MTLLIVHSLITARIPPNCYAYTLPKQASTLPVQVRISRAVDLTALFQKFGLSAP